MSRISTYLNLLILSTFLVGQVQYAYSSYFCTMTQQPVNAPTMKSAPSGLAPEAFCEKCQAVKPAQNGEQLNQGDCVKVITSEKSTLSSFTDSQKSIQHFAPIAFVINELSAISARPLHTTYYLIPTAASPPLDISILNSNLRI